MMGQQHAREATLTQQELRTMCAQLQDQVTQLRCEMHDAVIAGYEMGRSDERAAVLAQLTRPRSQTRPQLRVIDAG